MANYQLEIVEATSHQGTTEIKVISEPINHLLVALDLAKVWFARLVICNPNSKIHNDFTLIKPNGEQIQLRLQYVKN